MKKQIMKIGDLKKGQKVTLRDRIFPDKRILGEVTFVGERKLYSGSPEGRGRYKPIKGGKWKYVTPEEEGNPPDTMERVVTIKDKRGQDVMLNEYDFDVDQEFWHIEI